MKACVFPGQGSQFLGMGQALVENHRAAQQVFEEVHDALGFDLYKLIVQGPLEQLNQTEYTQPALMAVSVSVSRVIEAEFGTFYGRSIHYVAGHSLGEYSALTAIGAIPLTKAAVFLQARGRAMQQAVPLGEGGMLAVLGAPIELIHESINQLPQEVGFCAISNDNAPGQTVISGHQTALKALSEYLASHGFKKAIFLPVSAPFHCKLMKPAEEMLVEAFASLSIAKPKIPIVLNVTAQPSEDEKEIRQLLIRQMITPVRWRESIQSLKQLGVMQCFELGAGNKLCGLIKRIDAELISMSLQNEADIKQLKDVL
jgi:[acyl-carrier-protein] S-malonyltransferase